MKRIKAWEKENFWYLMAFMITSSTSMDLYFNMQVGLPIGIIVGLAVAIKFLARVSDGICNA